MMPVEGAAVAPTGVKVRTPVVQSELGATATTAARRGRVFRRVTRTVELCGVPTTLTLLRAHKDRPKTLANKDRPRELANKDRHGEVQDGRWKASVETAVGL